MTAADWNLLRQLRDQFLGATQGLDDYWQSMRLLGLYDRFFARRIAWKWQAVLGALAARGWTPPGTALVDWGCGTGVASREFLTYFPTMTHVEVSDRSAAAREFAMREMQAEHPAAVVTTAPPVSTIPGVWLLSHVLNELPESALEELMARLIQHASAVVWIEPGTHPVSRRLIAVREKLRETFQIIAPCPHQTACGLLTPANERHWCHHFATPPRAVFHDPLWSAFSREMQIDLRSVPYSHLVLDRRPVQDSQPETAIGRPRIYKGYAKVLTCTGKGVGEVTLQKKDDPVRFRQLRKD